MAKRRKLPFFAISAVTGEGIEPLKYAIAELVATHRPAPVEMTPRPHPRKLKPAYPPPPSSATPPQLLTPPAVSSPHAPRPLRRHLRPSPPRPPRHRRAAADAFALDSVLFAPTGRQPLKPGRTHTPFADRLAMVALDCA